MHGPIWGVDIYQQRVRIISSKETLTYLFTVPSLHKILGGVQAPVNSVQIQETSCHAFSANDMCLTVRKRPQHCYCSQCHGAWKYVHIETIWLRVWSFCLFDSCLCLILLMLFASLLTTPHHPSRHLWVLTANHSPKGCLRDSLMMITNDSLTQNILENVNDNSFYGYVKFSVQNFRMLT